MNVKKFIANSSLEALRKVKEDLGADAMILSNRPIPGGVEVLAAAQTEINAAIVESNKEEPKKANRISVTDEDGADETDYAAMIMNSRRANQKKAAENKPLGQAMPPSMTQILQQTAARLGQKIQNQKNAPKVENNAVKNAASAVKNAASGPQILHDPKESQKSTVNAQKISKNEIKTDQGASYNEVMAEIKALRSVIDRQLAGFAWGANQHSEPMKNEMLAWMLNAGFSPQFSRDLLRELPTTADRDEASAWVQRAADRALCLADSENDIVAQGGVFALVGPTGVGKTTTVAKLAARAVLKHGAEKVALITTDNYRVGAYEQLRIYGKILSVVVFSAKDSNELQQCLMELRGRHLVLIDTMGMSQRDKMVAELTTMLSNNYVQRIMLLNATSQGETLDDVVRSYAGAGVAGCILTKIDEAASVAGALDVIMRHKMRLHYVSNGQRVPEDLHLPNRSYLMHRAFQNPNAQSAHHLMGMEAAYKVGAH